MAVTEVTQHLVSILKRFCLLLKMPSISKIFGPEIRYIIKVNSNPNEILSKYYHTEKTKILLCKSKPKI